MKDKIVIITGASSGIGKSLAYKFAACGSKVIMAARNTAELKKIKNDIYEKGGEAIYIATDVSKESDCKQLIDFTISKFGRIDILINNAGISMRALFAELELNVIRKIMDINFWGTVYCSKYALPYLLISKGSLVGVSSIAGYKGLPGRTGYSASKFAMQGLLEVIRSENLRTGLHVLIACPGFTSSNIRNTALSKDGNMQGESPRDENKMMSSEEVANRIYKAVLKRKRSIILTFQGKMTVLMSRLLPVFVDKTIYNVMAKEHDSPFK
jgi:short-subunit dehydrogenase